MSTFRFTVYKCTCKVTGKAYVGVTTKDIRRRWAQHLYALRAAAERGHPLTYFWRAIQKHGEAAWTMEPIYEAEGSREEMAKAEQHFIRVFGTFVPGGYNLTTGGEGTPGRMLPMEARRHLSEMRRGMRASEETKAKMSRTRKGRPVPQEVREKLSSAQQGEKNHRWGKGHTDEWKVLLREQNSGEGNPFHGRKHSADSRTKMRVTLAARDFSGGHNPSARGVVADGRIYDTMRSAARDLGLTYM